MTPNTQIEGLDAEILAVRSELMAHIDGTLIPLMVRRSMARMALGQAASPFAIAAPASVTPAPVGIGQRPMASYVPSGTSARILDLLLSAPGGTMTSMEIKEALSDQKPDTVAKAMIRLYKDGFVSRKKRHYTFASKGPALPAQPMPKPDSSNLSVVLRILRTSPPEGMSSADVRVAAARYGLSGRQARSTCYNLMSRKLVIHDTEKGTWRLA